MDHQRPGSEQEPQQFGTVENDFVRPLSPMKNVAHRRLPAALPFAIAGLLVVSSVAFGATVIRNTVTPPPDASAVVVGDDNPTDSPSLVITASPTAEITASPTAEITASPTAAPTAVAPLTLVATIVGGKVSLAWTRYQGDGFFYYKVVRSTDATVSWPLGAGDTLVAASDNIDALTFVDAAPAGASATYEVFAVKSADDGYAVLVGSNVVTIAVPAPTPAPTKNCGITLSYTIIAPIASVGGIQPANGTPKPTTAPGYKVKLTWTKYQCDNFQWYGVQKSTSGDPVLQIGQIPNAYYKDDITVLTWTDTNVGLGKTYKYRAYAFTEKSLAAGAGGVQPMCYATTILAISNIVTVTIPAS